MTDAAKVVRQSGNLVQKTVAILVDASRPLTTKLILYVQLGGSFRSLSHFLHLKVALDLFDSETVKGHGHGRKC